MTGFVVHNRRERCISEGPISTFCVEKYEIVLRYTGSLVEREMLKNYILSERVGGPTI